MQRSGKDTPRSSAISGRLCQDRRVPQVISRSLEIPTTILRIFAGLPFPSVLVIISILYLWEISLLCCRNGILCNIVSENKPKRNKTKKRDEVKMTKGVKIKCKFNCLVIQIYHISVLCLRILFHTFTRLSSLIAIITIKYILIIKSTRQRLRNEAKWTLPDDIWTLSSILIFTWKHFFPAS